MDGKDQKESDICLIQPVKIAIQQFEFNVMLKYVWIGFRARSLLCGNDWKFEKVSLTFTFRKKLKTEGEIMPIDLKIISNFAYTEKFERTGMIQLAGFVEWTPTLFDDK